MKNLIIVLSFICVANFSFSQDILDGTPRDGAYDKDIRDGGKERMIQDYQYVREADVMWSTKIERVIDLREKMNQVFYYPLRPDNYIPMDFFDGSFDNQGGFGWDESEDDTIITNTNGNGQDSTFFEDFFSFDFEIDSIGWINCDYFYNSADPLTQVEVVLPDTFSGDNSAVFIYYSDINSVASLSDYDADGTFDLGASYSTPVGMEVTFVVISESDGTFFYNFVTTTITQDHVEVISALTSVTEAELEVLINNL